MTQRAASADPATDHITDAKGKTATLLASVWKRNRPLIEHRMAILELAGAGPLTGALQSEAADVAHKLAGSLGMFGFEQGTEIARELELLLESPVPDTALLNTLTAQLRCVLFPLT